MGWKEVGRDISKDGLSLQGGCNLSTASPFLSTICRAERASMMISLGLVFSYHYGVMGFIGMRNH